MISEHRASSQCVVVHTVWPFCMLTGTWWIGGRVHSSGFSLLAFSMCTSCNSARKTNVSVVKFIVFSIFACVCACARVYMRTCVCMGVYVQIAGFEAHSDYIRCVAIHPTQPYILTGSGKSLVQHASG